MTVTMTMGPQGGRREFQETVTLLTGPLSPAVRASLALLRPVTLKGREAAMVAELVSNASEIGDVAYGVVSYDLTPNRAALRVLKAHQPVHIASCE